MSTAPSSSTAPSTPASLADLLPAVAASLGAPLASRRGGGEPVRLPAARRVLVLLVDGLGDDLLVARAGHAPFLRSLLASRAVLQVTYPSTTVTSMGSFGTGLLPGAHGLVGYQVRDPGTGLLLNELSWEQGPDPRRWQPEATVFERVAATGVPVTRVGPGHFDGSGLTEAALRGGRYVAATSLGARVEAGLAALAATPRALVYVYWGEVDKAGHVHGVASARWGQELEDVDAAARRLAERLPDDALLVVTADHGMVDVPRSARWDLATDAELAAGVVTTGGEPRAPMLYCAPGAAVDVAATWRARLGDVVDVRLREEAVEAGWFGPVSARVLPRIGDVVAAATGAVAVHDSRVQRAALSDLLGMHGALTPAEVRVPLMVVGGRALDG